MGSQPELEHMAISLPASLPIHHRIFDMQEVFQIILGHLPPMPLLNSRLVSQQWNLNAQEVMKQKGWMIRIVGAQGPGGILEYIDRLKVSGATDSKPNLSVSLGVEQLATQKQISQGLSGMISLTTLNGRKAIKSFRFTCTPNWVKCWNEMFLSLGYIAPGLKQLTIEEKLSTADELSSRVNLDPAALPTNFPELVEFTYYPQEGKAGKDEMLRRIVNGSPKLEKLELHCDYIDKESLRVNGLHNRQLLRVYSVLSECTSVFAHLRKLSIPLATPQHCIALQRLHFPVLRKLCLSFMKRFEREQASELAIASFLVQNCPQLASLKLELDGTRFSFPIFPEGLPQLPNLTHFGYCFEHVHLPVFARSDNLHPGQFSNLTSVTVHFGQFVFPTQSLEMENHDGDVDDELEEVEDFLSEEEEEDSEGEEGEVEEGEEESDEDYCPPYKGPLDDWSVTEITFGQVHKLHLIIDGYWEPGVHVLVSHRDFAQHLHSLFPAVKELIVNIKIEQVRENAQIEKVLQHLLFGEIGSGIENLEIRNYYRDWLAVLFSRESSAAAVGTNLRGLKSLTLPALTKECKNLVDSDTVPGGKSLLSVPSLMDNVPDLEKLRVHDVFLRSKGAADDDERDIMEILEEFQLAHPRLTIELL